MVPLGDLQAPTTQHTSLIKVCYKLHVDISGSWFSLASFDTDIFVGTSANPALDFPVQVQLL